MLAPFKMVTDSSGMSTKSSDKPWWDTDPAKAKKEKPELETKVEQRFLRQAHKRGWKTRKLNGTGARSWHDQLIVAQGIVCLIEFKRPGIKCKLSPGQEIHHEECRALGIGHLSLVTDSDEEAIRFVQNLIVTGRDSLRATLKKEKK